LLQQESAGATAQTAEKQQQRAWKHKRQQHNH
jgi:hypothetical protein